LEAQVDGEAVAVGEQAARRGRVGVTPASGDRVDAVLYVGDDRRDRGRQTRGSRPVRVATGQPMLLLYWSACDEDGKVSNGRGRYTVGTGSGSSRGRDGLRNGATVFELERGRADH